MNTITIELIAYAICIAGAELSGFRLIELGKRTSQPIYDFMGKAFCIFVPLILIAMFLGIMFLR